MWHKEAGSPGLNYYCPIVCIVQLVNMKAISFCAFKSFVLASSLLQLASPAFSQLLVDSNAPVSTGWDYYVLKNDGSNGQPWEIGVYDSSLDKYEAIVKCKDSGCNVTDIQLDGFDPGTGNLVFSDDGENIVYFYDPKTGIVKSKENPLSIFNSNQPRPTITGLDEIRIGKNSLITRESNGKQELYAEDSTGSAIPINITNGSDLQVEGVSVMGEINKNAREIERNAANIESNRKNINDLGSGVASATALTAALSSLPVASDDVPFSCGVGTGGYSSRFAMGIGCATRVNKRLTFNVGGSHVFGGPSNYGAGSLDTFAARAGFVFKLGKVDSSSVTSIELQNQLDALKQENVSMKAVNKALMARLERLEATALGRENESSAPSLK